MYDIIPNASVMISCYDAIISYTKSYYIKCTCNIYDIITEGMISYMITDMISSFYTACILAWPGGGLNFEIHKPGREDLQVVCTQKRLKKTLYASFMQVTLKSLKKPRNETCHVGVSH